MSGLEGLGIVANVIAVVDLSLKVISWCSKYAQDVKNTKDSRVQLLLATHQIHFQSEKLRSLFDDERKRAKLQASARLAQAIGYGQSRLKDLESLLSNRSRGSGMKWPLQKQEVESAIHQIEQSTEAIMRVLEVDMAGILIDLDDKVEAEQQRNILDKLPYVSDAAFDSHAEEHNSTCLPETRVDLLKDVHDWINDPQAKTVFWLNGMAGTGKSTISRTLAQSLSKTQQAEIRLGASFFFKRGESDRGSMSKLVPTIARQLATSYPVLSTHIQQAIQNDPTIPGKALRIQFEKLITEPLSQSSRDFSVESTVVIIIDALDECESDNDIKLMINLFSQSRVIQRPRPRIFLTSRPDLPIRLGFKAIEGTYQNLVLHEVATPIIEHDIALFLRHELAQIRHNWNLMVLKSRNLSLDWPGDDNIQLITERATPLFIFAATVCRFIADYKGRNPARQLQKVIESQAGSTSPQMDITYRPVLSQLLPEGFPPSEIESIKHDFRRIVGSIVLLASPLSPSALSRLLDVPQDTIDDMLDNLHSVLNVPPLPEAPIRMLHLSFRDYLIRPEYSQINPMWVDEREISRALVRDCFRVMGGLKTDICQLQHPAKPRLTLKLDFIDACLPPEVQYACLSWVKHQESAGINRGDISAIFNFLKEHFLHWVEVLTLLGKIWEVTGLIRTLRSTLEREEMSDTSELRNFLDDAIMFLNSNISDINATPLQLYCSVLVFSPTHSIVGKILAAQTPPWITLISGRAPDWHSRLQVFKAGGDVMLTAFSSDSKLLSSVSKEGQIRVWMTDTGECIEELDLGFPLDAAAISPDLKAIAIQPSQDDHGGVRVIDLMAGGCVSHLGKPTTFACALKFSQDSARILSASLNGEVIVWDRATGNYVQKLLIKPSANSWSNIRLSPLATAIVLVGEDREIHVWCLEREKEILRTHAQGNHREVNPIMYDNERGTAVIRDSISFSHDDKLLAVISGEHEVQIWSLQAAECIRSLREDKCIIMGMLLSLDSSRIATLFNDRNLQIWDISTGERLYKLPHWEWFIGNAQFSPETDHIVSIFSHTWWSRDPDSDLQIWFLNGQLSISQTNLPRVKSLLFSPDGTVLSCVSCDGLIHLWDWPRLSSERPRDSDKVIALRFISSPPRVVRMSAEGNVKVLSTDTGARVHGCRIHTPSPMSWGELHFSPDSTLVAPREKQAQKHERLEIWDLVDGRIVFQLKDKDAWLAFSHDSQSIATITAAEPCEICVWNRKKGGFDLSCVLTGPEGRCGPPTFSLDAKWLAAVDDSERIWCWDLDTQKCIRTIPAMEDAHGQVGKISISTELAVIAALLDDEIIVWDLTTGKRVGAVSKSTHSITLSSFGTFVVCSSYQGIRIWNWETGLCLAEAESPGTFCEVLEFLPDNSGLHTNLGTFTFPSGTLATLEPGSRPRHLPIIPTFAVREQWIQHRGHDLVKLPAECHDKEVAVLGNNIALEGESGNIILLRLLKE